MWASPSHLTRKSTEACTQATSAWIRDRVGGRPCTDLPPGGRLRRVLAGVRKELAGRFYQLLSGHAATAEHLVRVGQASSDRCWWCGSGEKQTRHHPSAGYPRFDACGGESRLIASRGTESPLGTGPLPRHASNPCPLGVPRGHQDKLDAKPGPPCRRPRRGRG